MIALVLALACADPAPAPSVLVPFASPESITRLERSKHKADFFTLANQYEGQQNGGYCGIASGVIVLNALRIDNPNIVKPVDATSVREESKAFIPKQYDPYLHRYSQRTFFDDKFTSVKSIEAFSGKPQDGKKFDGGLQIRQLGDILKANGLDVQVRIVDDKLVETDAKKEIVDNLGRAGDYVIVNYTRGALGQKGGGHISPLAAYDEASDSFLILDVNPNDGKTWAWVPSASLFAAMRTKDNVENRGFLLVREGLK